MRTIIANGTLFTPLQSLPEHDLVIEDNLIAGIYPRPGRGITSVSDEQVIDATGLGVGPGLIDLHVHGGAGGDTMDATPAALHRMAGFLARHGVTAYLPTTITAPRLAILAAIANVATTPQPDRGARHLGVHLEGPAISAAHRGAQPPESIRLPDSGEFQEWLSIPGNVVRLISLAPELPGALEWIESGRAQGIRFSAGHTQATYDQVIQAADHGLTHATHTFNGMSGLHHREPGAAGAVLTDDRIYAELIADGIHVHPAVIRLLVRAKGIERTLLVSDAMRAAGMTDGVYNLGGQQIQVREGVARAPNGGLASSTLTLDRAIINIMKFTGLTLNQALAMATLTPAESMGGLGARGRLRAGAQADLILFDASFTIRATLVAGRVVYQNLSQ